MPSNPSPTSQSAIALPGYRPALAGDIQDHLGQQLRLADEAMGPWPVPESLRILAATIDCHLALRTEAQLSEFRDGIVEAQPILRAFAISLTKSPDRADDLVQATMLQALSKRALFQPGTNLNAWLFTILRNGYYTDYRRRSREVADPDGAYAAQLTIAPGQMDGLNLQDLQNALPKLAPDQREALLLVGAHGLTYEEAATVSGIPIGTIKSRVNRARLRLAELLGYAPEELMQGQSLQSRTGRQS
ncbi:sigma-70 family RNA polymerase sigma factor [Microvirga lotononidis]|uniref:RNA polymerase sigma factor n=1 Tax=Microvirga lotononidis TaxID=864069 RepID=I4Z4R0_9HYPH|nr:sigma-70 family RNA polymerase sigma factor [Microvirga lotononidis]EIM31202.1 RNA polymerase sigma factor, sigma-70 family [Microvirga lotononidis]WQO29943.1 sigma-70 family RNA polymerase sigma factor [Microvirga lotononidis]WQO30566.1 sigma-70 family RNA polymerase sigma factor [Microvirga lotononidis]